MHLPPLPAAPSPLLALLDLAAEPLAVWGRQGELLYANRAWRAAFGELSGADWMGRLLQDGAEALALAFEAGLPCGPALVRWQPDGPAATAFAGECVLQPFEVGQGVAGWLVRWSDREALVRAECRAHVLAERLDVAQEFGRLGVWERDVGTGAGYWDDHVFRFYGLPPGDGAPSFEEASEHIHPDDRVRMRELWSRSLRSAGRYDAHFRVMQPGGGLKRIHAQWLVKTDASGAPARVVGVMLDDTESYEIARRMESVSTHLTMAAELVGLVMWRQDWQTGITHFNAEGARLLGLPRPQPMGIDDIRAHVHPDDRAAAARANERAASQAGPVDQALRYLQSDGTVKSVLTRRVAERDAEGRCVAIIGVALDLTDRERTEAALVEARERVALATEAVGMGTWERDLMRDQSFWDAQMYRLRGLPANERRPVNELRIACMHPDDVEGMLQTYEGALSNPNCEVVGHEFRVVWPDGTVRWLASRGHIVRAADGRALRMLGVNWDVTELKQAEQTRREKEAAEQASRAKSEFLARMSHELRTPLNAVLGFTQVLQADTDEPLTPSQRSRVEHIVAAGRHLLALIDDVLDLARIESGALELEARTLSLDEVLADAMDLVAPIARKHGIRLRVEAVEGLVVADRRRLRQVLMNLLSNAIKYNRPGGDVVVGAQGRPPWAWICVRDTGRGMSEEQLGRLFEPFNRLGMEREGIEGTGIGLAIAQQLVRHMGGVIKVRSRVGEGSEFRVWLPAGEEGARTALRTQPGALPMSWEPGAGLRLLYIEDNPVNVLLVEELVRLRPGVELAIAGSGLEGVEQAARLQPDLVIVDMQLPDIEGDEVLRRLKARQETAALRCVALSANAMPEDVERALAAGFEAYWTKPIDVQRFWQSLEQLLGRGRPA
ncbi:MAG TPA: PAS domain-containing protein [Burkholderiaceae bacterium]|nr:PAS domain-containing protein [Burkholderiaceae bacterium]